MPQAIYSSVCQVGQRDSKTLQMGKGWGKIGALSAMYYRRLPSVNRPTSPTFQVSDYVGKSLAQDEEQSGLLALSINAST